MAENMVRLTAMTPEMYHRYFREYENDPDLYLDKDKYTAYTYSKEKVDQYIQRQVDLKRIPLAIMTGDEIVGEIIIKNIEEHKCATMGLSLKNARYKDRGIGTQAEKLAIQYVFRDLDIPTLYADSIQTNTRSQHVLEKVGFTLTHEDKDFKYYRIDRDMNIELKKMETDDEIRGKAYVHWKSWHEAYPGLVDQGYLDAMTLEKCEKMAYSWPDNLIVAKDNGRVIGFVGYGDRGDEAPNTGEIFALYVLAEYYGKGVAQQLMKAGLQQLTNYPQVCLWVLKENKRAIRFYEKCGFVPTGEELISSNIGAAEIRMVLKCER
jgi:RimJ/RimL family protein N-acetyltransferase